MRCAWVCYSYGIVDHTQWLGLSGVARVLRLAARTVKFWQLVVSELRLLGQYETSQESGRKKGTPDAEM